MAEPCDSTYKVAAGTVLQCTQHLGRDEPLEALSALPGSALVLDDGGG